MLSCYKHDLFACLLSLHATWLKLQLLEGPD